MTTQTEVTAQLGDVLASMQKTAGEIVAVQGAVTDLKAQVASLEAIIAAGGEVSPALVAAVADLKAQAQLVDDLIPDSPTPPVG